LFQRAAFEEGDVSIEVTVRDIISKHNGKYSFLAETETMLYEGKISESNIIIEVTLLDDIKFSVGDKLNLLGKLYFLQSLRNPGGFDEKAYYRVRNVEYKMYPNNAVKIGEENNLFVFLDKISFQVCNVYDNILPKEEASLIKAMIVGDRTDLSRYIKNLFSKAGIYHIIAISGLHIHIFSFIILFFTEKLHKRYGKIFAAILAVLYCVFTGASVSSVRAICMFLVYIFGRFIYRESDVLNSLAVSCFIILIFQPLYLFDIGFQYSFCAVLSLVIFSRPIAKFFSKKLSAESSEILSSAISVNFISRAVLWNGFYGFNVIDILANLIVIPLAGIVVAFGFFAGILGCISLDLARFFSGIVYIILRAYEFICEIISDIPFSYVLLGKPMNFELIFYLLIVFAFALYLYKFIKMKFFVFFTLFVILASFVFGNIKNDELKITMLDVGQGDCFVFNYKDDCFIIDGGGVYDKDFGDDKGVKVLFPYLNYMGVDYVSTIFITHMDVDHVKGIIEILDCVDVGKIYISFPDNENDLYNNLCQKAEEKNVPVCELHEDDRIIFDDEVTVDCIYPSEKSYSKGNDSSLVLKVIFRNNSFLFTGDIDAEVEKKIVSSGKDINADVLKLSHHGSKYSNCDEFIDRVAPSLAIVSAGNFDRYGHPDKSVLERFDKRNVEVLNTHDTGAVEIYSDGNNIYYDKMIRQ